MTVIATLSQSMTWTQKQLVGLLVVGGILVFFGVRSAKGGRWLTVAAIVAILFWLSRGIGQGAP